jgi:hypothetical protein
MAIKALSFGNLLLALVPARPVVARSSRGRLFGYKGDPFCHGAKTRHGFIRGNRQPPDVVWTSRYKYKSRALFQPRYEDFG